MDTAKTMLNALLHYTWTADQLYIDQFNSANIQMERAEYLFSHILNAQHIWSSRIYNQQPLYERFDIHPVSVFQYLHNQNKVTLDQVLDQYGLSSNVFYANSAGEKFCNKVSDILFHVVNHSTYHRGQVASQLKLAGIEPPVTDFVAFKREGII